MRQPAELKHFLKINLSSELLKLVIIIPCIYHDKTFVGRWKAEWGMGIYKDLSETELIALLKRQDREAFTEIYKRFSMQVLYKVRQMLREEDVAKDVVQEVFFYLWDKSADLHISGTLGAYLYVASRNLVLKHIQRSKFSNDYLNSIAQYASEADLSTLQEIDEREINQLIQKEIARLPDRMRIIFEMSRNENLSHAEIAERLGISEHTVKSQVHNALKILKGRLELVAPLGLVILELTKRA